MKLTKASATWSLAALAVIASPFAIAQDTGWYAGVNAGRSKAKIDDVRIISGLLGSGFTTTSIVDDNRDSGYKIYGGYQLNRHFAIEGGYFDLGQFGFRANTLPLGTFSGDIKLKGWNLDLVGIVPLTERFSVFGRVGANHAEARDEFRGTGLVIVRNRNFNERDTNAKYGVGLQYAFTPSFGMRAEVERYRVNDAVGNRGDVDLFSIGLLYRFGRHQARPVSQPMTPEPAYIAPPPPPAPVIVAPPPPPPPPPPPAPPRQPSKVSFSTDALFDFDSAAMKADGKQHLDQFAASVRGTTFDVINLTGHADRIGSANYNMKLSTQRAESVRNYLVETAQIPAGKISARGVGESEPVTRPEDCKGSKPTKALIACLQPDRRVDAVVTGTK